MIRRHTTLGTRAVALFTALLLATLGLVAAGSADAQPVELITEVHDDAVLVPKKALVYDADQLFIFRLLEDDTVERLLIEARLEDRDNIEPAGILQEGDRIIVAGQASLKDGSEVRLVGAAAVEEAAEESAE